MSYAPRYALLAALCVLGVTFAATLFPAAGIDAHPGGTLDRSDGDAPTVTPGGDGDDPTPTPEGTPSDSLTETVSPTESTDTTESGPETVTPTDPQTDSPIAAQDPDTDRVGHVWLLLGGIGLVVLVVVLGRYSMGDSGDSGGGRRPPGSDAGSDAFASLPVPSLGSLPAATMTAMVRGATSAGPVFRGILDTGGSVLGGIGDAVSSFGGRLATGTTRLGRGFGTGLSLFDRRSLSLGRPGRSRSTPPSADPRHVDARPADSDEPTPETVAEWWTEMADRVPVDRPTVRTPGEVARAAVVAGFPAGAVGSLTDVFREVRYGGKPDDESRRATAQQAYGEVDDADEDDRSTDGADRMDDPGADDMGDDDTPEADR